ncbi:MAG: LamG-like jellyroll fold domain-containing protein [Candidatus Daviesbacteria bacterium]|nr:LamG-like jellyroll fold domain-containing protein [Candidatus Daviesbacteria bacterium]
MEVWVNGIKGNQFNGTIGSLSNPSKAFEIGRSFNPYYFNGSIDDVRIYNRALSAGEVTNLFNADPQ